MSMQVRLHCFEAVHAGARRRQSPHQHDMQAPVKVQHAMLLQQSPSQLAHTDAVSVRSRLQINFYSVGGVD